MRARDDRVEESIDKDERVMGHSICVNRVQRGLSDAYFTTRFLVGHFIRLSLWGGLGLDPLDAKPLSKTAAAV